MLRERPEGGLDVFHADGQAEFSSACASPLSGSLPHESITHTAIALDSLPKTRESLSKQTRL